MYLYLNCMEGRNSNKIRYRLTSSITGELKEEDTIEEITMPRAFKKMACRLENIEFKAYCSNEEQRETIQNCIGVIQITYGNYRIEEVYNKLLNVEIAL